MKRIFWLMPLLLATASPALADDRPFCADRPGLGTPACTMVPGEAMVEIGLADWTMDRDTASRTDEIDAGDILARFGLADHLEVQLGWTAYGHERVRDRGTGAVDKDSGTGDVTLAFRRNLSNPDGSGFSLALMPYATVPVGSSPIGGGDWSAGLIAPIGFDLSDQVNLALTPEIDAAVDEDGSGRHLAFGSVLGLEIAVSSALETTIEVQAMRDDDPDDHHDEFLASASLAWQPDDRFQIDAGFVAGLNPAAPDIELYAGIARRF